MEKLKALGADESLTIERMSGGAKPSPTVPVVSTTSSMLVPIQH